MLKIKLFRRKHNPVHNQFQLHVNIPITFYCTGFIFFDIYAECYKSLNDQLPNITAKCLHLLPLWAGSDRLRLFRADLEEEGSFDEAVKGCDGVFHVAASMQFSVPAAENSGIYTHKLMIPL